LIEQVFQPHFTLKKNGSGLGLSITKSVVQQLSGTIKVSSLHGAWTVVEIWLPKG
jgi:signal transduction histidine kinase